MAAPFGPPFNCATRTLSPLVLIFVSCPVAISVTNMDPSGRDMGPSGKLNPSAILQKSDILILHLAVC